MVEDKGKKLKVSERGEDDNSDNIDEKLVLSIEKLQEIQDELEKVKPINPPVFFVHVKCFLFLDILFFMHRFVPTKSPIDLLCLEYVRNFGNPAVCGWKEVIFCFSRIML